MLVLQILRQLLDLLILEILGQLQIDLETSSASLNSMLGRQGTE